MGASFFFQLQLTFNIILVSGVQHSGYLHVSFACFIKLHVYDGLYFQQIWKNSGYYLFKHLSSNFEFLYPTFETNDGL